MNKRVLARSGSFIAAATLLATSLSSGVMAASKVELAKNIDDFSFKTVAYKTEATTDGGYIVGGKTIVCAKTLTAQVADTNLHMRTQSSTPSAGALAPFEIVDIDECNKASLAPADEKPVVPPAQDELEGTSATQSSEDTTAGDDSEGGISASIESEDNTIADQLNEQEPKQEAEQEPKQEAEPIDLAAIFDDVCSGTGESASASNQLSSDDGATYSYECVDYMSKYTSAGKSVWAKIIYDNTDILGVGETSTDYRLMTINGDVYTFTKDKGEMSSLHLQYEGEDLNYVFDEEGDIIVNNDGTLIVSDDEGLALFDKSGDFVRAFEPDDGWEYDSFSNYVSNSVSVSGGKILMIREKEDDSKIGYKAEIVEVSKDLKTVKKRLPGISGSVESGQVTMRYPMGGNKNGDMIVLAGTITQPKDSEKSTTSFRYESYDKDNKLIGTYDMGNEVTKVFMNGYVAYNVDGLFGGHGDDIADIDEAEKAAQDSDSGSKKLEFYTRTLEYIGSYQIANSDEINDYTVLNNGTLVAVGATQEENSPNGLRAHLAAAVTTKPVANPSTIDNVQLVILLSGAAALGAAVLTRKKLVRR